MKFAETIKEGFYYIEKHQRCFYFTGTLKGNKWIDLEVPNPEWMTLMWTCIDKEDVKLSTYHETNPIKFEIN